MSHQTERATYPSKNLPQTRGEQLTRVKTLGSFLIQRKL
jgi:hypothetical protein